MKNFYCKGKFFDTLAEMEAYIKKWPDLPVDLEQYRQFLDDRFREIEINCNAYNGEFTNRHAYYLMYANVEWAKGVD